MAQFLLALAKCAFPQHRLFSMLWILRDPLKPVSLAQRIEWGVVVEHGRRGRFGIGGAHQIQCIFPSTGQCRLVPGMLHLRRIPAAETLKPCRYCCIAVQGGLRFVVPILHLFSYAPFLPQQQPKPHKFSSHSSVICLPEFNSVGPLNLFDAHVYFDLQPLSLCLKVIFSGSKLFILVWCYKRYWISLSIWVMRHLFSSESNLCQWYKFQSDLWS